MELREHESSLQYLDQLKQHPTFFKKHKKSYDLYLKRVCKGDEVVFENKVKRFMKLYDTHKRYNRGDAFQTTMRNVLTEFMGRKEDREPEYETLFRGLFGTIRRKKNLVVAHNKQEIVQVTSPYRQLKHRYGSSVLKKYRGRIAIAAQKEELLNADVLRTIISEVGKETEHIFSELDVELFLRNYLNHHQEYFKKNNIQIHQFGPFDH